MEEFKYTYFNDNSFNSSSLYGNSSSSSYSNTFSSSSQSNTPSVININNYYIVNTMVNPGNIYANAIVTKTPFKVKIMAVNYAR